MPAEEGRVMTYFTNVKISRFSYKIDLRQQVETFCVLLYFRYFATGSADALISLWDLDELVCVRTFSRLE